MQKVANSEVTMISNQLSPQNPVDYANHVSLYLEAVSAEEGRDLGTHCSEDSTRTASPSLHNYLIFVDISRHFSTSFVSILYQFFCFKNIRKACLGENRIGSPSTAPRFPTLSAGRSRRHTHRISVPTTQHHNDGFTTTTRRRVQR